ncbi:MAG: hypothetical protein HRU41_24500 [Saprospiraceae bacterium]|nr:hypothetical protein [Saprospiraceae bacterium]
MKITQELFQKVQATQFLRPKFSNIEFEYVHTKLENIRKRRGNYRFKVLLPYRQDDEIKRIETHFALQPIRSFFFITHTLIHEQTSIDEFLKNLSENNHGQINGNAALITSEQVIDDEKLEAMKNGLIEALTDTDPQEWENKSGRICITVGDIGIYKFKPLIAF